MYKPFLLLVFLAASHAEVTLDDVIKELQRRKQMSSGEPALSIRNGVTESCSMPGGAAGECVPYYLCGPNGIIDDGTNLLDIRVKNPECESYIDVCCLPGDRHVPEEVPKPDLKTGCGWLNSDGVTMRITGGVGGEANFGEFPWIVALLKSESEAEGSPAVYLCGGSLIHPSIVLTAAHHVHSVAAKSLLARAGEWDTVTSKEPYPYQDRRVREVVVHRDFNTGNLFNDIALLFLSAPMTLAPNVGPACLPPAGARPAPGARCLVAGWGKDVFGDQGNYQSILKKMEVPAVAHQPCQAALRRTRLGRRFTLRGSFVCAGGEPGRDACRGDGGSPLVCPSETLAGRYIQYGIVAWGIGCGTTVPGVYTHVGGLRAWVDAEVTRRGFDPAVYTLQ